MRNVKKWLPQIAAAIASIIFGFSFLFTKNALETLDIFQLLGVRFFVAALFLLLLKKVKLIKIEIHRSHIKGLLLVALFQPVLYFIGETKGVDLTSASESGIMIALVPVAVTVLAALMLKERLKMLQWVSIFVSVGGGILIILPRSTQGGKGNLLGILFLLGAVFSAAFYNILSRRISKTSNPITTTYIMMWVGAIAFNGIGIIQAITNHALMDYFSIFANTGIYINIIYLGIISSIGAFLLLNYALSKMEASKVSVFLNVIPLISVLAGVFIRGEKFYFIQCVGGAIIILGVWGVNRKQNIDEKKIGNRDIEEITDRKLDKL